MTRSGTGEERVEDGVDENNKESRMSSDRNAAVRLVDASFLNRTSL